MLNSFSIALSALTGNSVAVDAIGNNLANMNTTGYKDTVTAFHDMLTVAIGGSGSELGTGIGAPAVARQFTQGSIQVTGGAMDAAIQGQGFFVVHDQNDQEFYTRAGNFHLDSAGNLLSSTGQKVQGWNAVGGKVSTAGAAGNITVPVAALNPPIPTKIISANLNLDASAAKDTEFAVPVDAVDALGAKHVITMTFKSNGDGTWDYTASIPGEEKTGGTAGKPSDLGITGTVKFDKTGVLKTPDAKSGTVDIKIPDLADGAAELDLTWSFYNTDDSPRLTQYKQASAISTTSQDGAEAGQLTGVAIEDGGKVVAQYSNGQQQAVGQIALASILNPESMISVGNNNLRVSAATATPVIGEPETGARGKIAGGSLESSTVDMAREFTNLIVMERSYQANAKVITTTDEIMQETVSLKR